MGTQTDDERRKANAVAAAKYRATHVFTPEQVARRKATQLRWSEAHKAEKSVYNRQYTQLHRAEKRASNLRRQKQRLANDPYFRLSQRVRNRLGEAIRKAKGRKSANTFKLVGCDTLFLAGYLEARFKPGMSWANYGDVWVIDHRIPCTAFDLRDASHQRSCFHYSNLQPLFRTENAIKGAQLPDTHQAELI